MCESRRALASVSAGQTKECYIYRLACTGSIDETVLERQTRKGGLLDMLDRKPPKLPPAHSPDRDLLFKLDGPNIASRLYERLPTDSPYADRSVWVYVDLGESDVRVGRECAISTSWLQCLARQRLLLPPHSAALDPPAVGSKRPLREMDAVAAVTSQESDCHLITFIWSRVEGSAATTPPAAAATAAVPAAAAPAAAAPVLTCEEWDEDVFGRQCAEADEIEDRDFVERCGESDKDVDGETETTPLLY